MSIEFLYPETLTFGKWIGISCQQGFYTFFYNAQDSEQHLITEDGTENLYDLDIPLDHRLNFISFARKHIDSEALDILYTPVGIDWEYADILYSNSALVAKSVLIELGSHYENVGSARLRFKITGTNLKKWLPRVNIQFLEKPRDV